MTTGPSDRDPPNNEGPPDEALVRACLAGDAHAWEDLSRGYGGLIRRTVRRIAQRQGAGSEADVEEITAGVFEALVEDGCRRLKRYDARYPLAVFLRIIARGRALDELRARRRRREAESAAPPAEARRTDDPDAEARDELRARVDRLLAGLPERERAIIRLYFFADRTCPEIARLLRIPENTVYSLLRRTLERLRPAARQES